EEDFVNDLEAQNDADAVAEPIQVKVDRIVLAQECGEDHGESQNLGDHVGEEEFEPAMHLPMKHDGGDPRLQERMRDPESVIEDSDFFAHRPTTLALGEAWREP